MGFQVTTASWAVSLMNAVAMSESEVLTSLTCRDLAFQAADRHGPLEKILRDGLLDHQHLFARQLRDGEIAADEQSVIAVGVVAGDDRSRVDSGCGRHIESFHVRHRAGVDVLRDEGVE